MQAGEDKSKFYLNSQSKKTKFEHYPLKEEVIELLKDNNFRKPTLVQADSLPITLQDNLKNLCVIVYAYNGAGKTLTYFIPIFNALQNIPCVGQKFDKNKDHEIGRPQAIIVVPTEALLAQVYEYLQTYADFYEVAYKWNIKIGRVYSTVSENGHILIGLARKMQEKLKQPGKFDLS
jgi:superfamily II DNA/RNA helicase